jgi:hypothetical protein
VRRIGALGGGLIAGVIGLEATMWIAAIGGIAGVVWLLPSGMREVKDVTDDGLVYRDGSLAPGIRRPGPALEPRPAPAQAPPPGPARAPALEPLSAGPIASSKPAAAAREPARTGAGAKT